MYFRIHVYRGAIWLISEILSKIKANLSHWILRWDNCDKLHY